ncbi:MAG: hypothetical protein R3E01_12975 [Pirellulaceae bacterium]
MTQQDWLERLQEATEYRELQAIFSEIAAVARRAGRDPQLAASIDEAIRRIEQERLRDETSLQDAQQQHNEFKQQQSGVVGWFKRHLPFTEARKQDKAHQQEINEQRAEVLADNLIIARAQMLKEQLLEPDQRRCGHDAGSWQQQLGSHDSPRLIAEYATQARRLEQENIVHKAFVDALRHDIEAFAGAAFSRPEDQHRKNSDLSAARGELESVARDLTSKQTLFEGSLKRMGDLVRDELLQSHQDYRDLSQRIGRTKGLDHCVETIQSIGRDLTESATAAGEKATQLAAIPDRRHQLQRDLEQSQWQARERAEQHEAMLARHRDQATRYAELQSQLNKVQAAAQAAHRLYQAYLAETGQSETDTTTMSPEASPVASEHLRCQQELQMAQRNIESFLPDYEAARRELQSAESAATQEKEREFHLAQQLSDLQKNQSAVAHQMEDHHQQMHELSQRLRPLLEDFDRFSQEWGFSGKLQQMIRRSSSHRGTHDLLPSPSGNDSVEWNAARERYEELSRAIAADADKLERQFKADREQARQIWHERCQQLLGDDLAKRIATAG